MIDPIEIVTARDLTPKRGSTLGVLAFGGPSYMGNNKEVFTRLYFEKLLEHGPFMETLLVPREPRSDEEALRIGIDAQCDAILMGGIDHMVESSGATPTSLEIHIRILDTQTGHLLAYFRQRAQSLPGADVDLYWKVIDGEPSLRAHGLAELLAEQASRQLSSMAWRIFD
jgi:hypothetical protein